jgi:hypothetical protein
VVRSSNRQVQTRGGRRQLRALIGQARYSYCNMITAYPGGFKMLFTYLSYLAEEDASLLVY